MLALPVPLGVKAQQHFARLLREFALIAGGGRGEEHHAPARLMRLVDSLTAAYGGINTGADRAFDDAAERGAPVIDDLVLQVPPAAGPAAQALAKIIDEADEYCRQGEHLLTLATPPDCVAYRRWYLGQVLDQLTGKPPVPWPDSSEARSLLR